MAERRPAGWKPASQVLGDFPELGHRLLRLDRVAVGGMGQAVVDVVVDQGLLRRRDRLLDGVKLLGEINAGPLVLHHLDDGPHMPLGAFQAFDDFRMRRMRDVCHAI